MVRPLKLGIDYFPMDTDMDQDDKIQMIEAKYPEKGFEIITKLFMKIYKEGYCYKWGEKEQLLFTNKIPNVDNKYINDVINDAVKWELFDKNIFEKYNVLTSNGIQKRYLEAIKRRKDVELIQEYWINVDNNGYNDNINFKILYTGTQNKLKETIINQNIPKKENEIKYFGLELPFKEQKFKDTLDKFFIHRTDIHKPFKINSLELFLLEVKKICATSNQAIELMNKSIIHGWPSIYELTDKNNGKDKTNKPKSVWDRFGVHECPKGHDESNLSHMGNTKSELEYHCSKCKKTYFYPEREKIYA